MMETKYGVNGTIVDTIFFTESNIPETKFLKQLHVEISRQNSNLMEIKKQLANEALALGATAIMNFRYGQKKHKPWELIFTFKWDTESWYGEGDAIII